MLELDAAATLGFVVDRRRRQDVAAAEELRAVAHWADLHRLAAGEVLGAVEPETANQLCRRGLLGEDLTIAGVERELRLSGQGAFLVEEFAVAEVAAALGMTESAGRGYVGQAVELRDRLPRLWGRVMSGELPAWKARQVAEQTIPLSSDAAGYVDAQLAGFAHKISFGRILACVEAAALRHDPDLAAERARQAAEKRGVWVEDRIDGTSEIKAVTGTPDARAFDAALNHVATALNLLGDGDSRDVRRAKAIGVLADPQYALDLTTSSGDGTRTAALHQQGRRPQAIAGPVVHIHLHTAAVAGVQVGAAAVVAVGEVARVDGVGPRSTEAIKQWLATLAPGAVVKVTPVVDLSERISVDAYEIPDRLRRQVEERDHSCRFPWCGRRGGFDVDHIDAFVPRDDGGPPGQTNTHNLARLCRFHHRVKTHSRWSYVRRRDGVLVWTSPLGRTYTVDESGTSPATEQPRTLPA